MASYTVQTGDTLSAIAKRNGTTVAELLRLNPKLTSDPKYKDGSVIFNGTKIALPGTTTRTPAASTTTATPPPVSTAPVPPMPSATVPVLPAPAMPAPEQPGSNFTYGQNAAPTYVPPALPVATPVPATSQTIPTAIPEVSVPTVSVPSDLPTVSVPSVSAPPVVDTSSAPQTQYLIDPYTGKTVLDMNGMPIEIRPGGNWKDRLDYIVRQRQAKEASMQAGAANKLAVSQATATGETARRGAERELFRSQQRALNELSRRGLAGAPGLTRAAKRAYGAEPLAQRLEAIRKMQSDISAANLLLAKQQQDQQAAEEASQIALMKATGIVNKIGGN